MQDQKTKRRKNQGKAVQSPPGDPLRHFEQKVLEDPDKRVTANQEDEVLFYSYKNGKAAADPLRLMVIYVGLPAGMKSELVDFATDLYVEHNSKVSKQRSAATKKDSNKENIPPSLKRPRAEEPKMAKKKPRTTEEFNKAMLAAKTLGTLPRPPVVPLHLNNALAAMSQHDTQEVKDYEPANSDLDDSTGEDDLFNAGLFLDLLG